MGTDEDRDSDCEKNFCSEQSTGLRTYQITLTPNELRVVI